MRFRTGLWVLGAALSVVAISAAAQTPQPGSTLVPNDGATLYQITEGVFTIEAAQVVDLTNENVLYTFFLSNNGEPRCSINGDDRRCWQGLRLDFKNLEGVRSRVANDLKNRFAGKDRCFLDVVAFSTPAGAAATGTFRLICI